MNSPSLALKHGVIKHDRKPPLPIISFGVGTYAFTLTLLVTAVYSWEKWVVDNYITPSASPIMPVSG